MSLIERAVERLERNNPDAAPAKPDRAPGEFEEHTPAAASSRRPPREPLPAAAAEAEAAGEALDARPGRPATATPQTVDLEGLAAMGYLTPTAREGPLAEELRRIKRPLLHGASAEARGPVARGNVILITSSVPDEGKTFIAINLAMSICADVDRTVLLIDCDTRRSRIASRLGLQPSPGILDVIEGKHTLGEAIIRTSVPTLSVLPAGQPRAGAEELFASEQMQSLVDEIASRYPDRVIIIDSPPLLAASESAVLARLAGSVVVVVRADSTSNQHLRQALDTLEGCDSVSLLLNAASRFLGDSSHYYGYYGSEGASTAETPQAPTVGES